MAKPHPESLVEIYIDESSQTKHRYLILGGIIVQYAASEHIISSVQKARLPELPAKEAKWTKVSAPKLEAYKRIVDVLFDNAQTVQFHSLVVDTTKLDHRRFNEGDREIGFNKEIYQLAMKFARLYPAALFHVYPDYRETTQKPDDLRLILNRGCAKRDWPFRRIQFRDSKTTQLLQLTDIVTGAIGFHINGHAKADGASKPKLELSRHVFERAGIRDVMKDTAINAPFSIWHRKLK